ncbi:MAG: YkgJ family cysteine cluster protein [Spirochaetes bacterium]|nr:YkgJ family cysteine cluster protein [Spirochaetota bacterium]
MNHFIPVDCSGCKKCCLFHVLVGEILSLSELQEDFFFSQHQCQTFFKKTKTDHFEIGSVCQQYQNTLCKIHDQKELLPFSCALYPFILAIGLDGEKQILLDHQCPQAEKLREQFADKNFQNQFFSVIKAYQARGLVEYIPLADLVECGYKPEVCPQPGWARSILL